MFSSGRMATILFYVPFISFKHTETVRVTFWPMNSYDPNRPDTLGLKSPNTEELLWATVKWRRFYFWGILRHEVTALLHPCLLQGTLPSVKVLHHLTWCLNFMCINQGIKKKITQASQFAVRLMEEKSKITCRAATWVQISCHGSENNPSLCLF